MAQHRQTAEALSADLYTGAKLQLLTGDGTLGERLAGAYFEMAVHAAPLAQQLPGELGTRVLALHGLLSGGGESHDTPDRAAIVEAVGGLAPDQLIRAALDIADLADDLDAEVRTSHAVIRTAD
jgi:hypothetical protein